MLGHGVFLPRVIQSFDAVYSELLRAMLGSPIGCHDLGNKCWTLALSVSLHAVVAFDANIRCRSPNKPRKEGDSYP
jgi:hypothetical protein